MYRGTGAAAEGNTDVVMPASAGDLDHFPASPGFGQAGLLRAVAAR
jgi:hypothetical protein